MSEAWTDKEIAILESGLDHGTPPRFLCQMLPGRTLGATKVKLSEIRRKRTPVPATNMSAASRKYAERWYALCLKMARNEGRAA